ncbi:MAG TPA: rhodanese-like domain-containing protein [Candidatus Limnocylindrales bacterium]|nr:rhodanese-like domain-containing protein [Candidatus Limnocylindrales bacterium]
MYLRQFQIDGLGHLSAVIADDGRGLAAVVDPRRDVDVYLEEARQRDLRITHVLETHLHNDYVSGARELAALTGAEHVIGVGAELAFAHRPVRQGDVIEVGSLRFEALETPGHTPEHVAYAVVDRSRAESPLLVFTGGSLLVGAVGRTDLLGAENAEPWARDLFRSLHERLLTHDDHVTVLPTHGGGSLCSKEIATTPWSTIGFERRHNPMLQFDEVEAFVKALLTDQPAFPRYFARMRPVNQSGPPPLGEVPAPRPLPVEQARALLEGDHLLVDLRSPGDHMAAHVPGSVSIPAGSSFGTWLGWVVPHDRPLILLLPSVADWDDAVRQALRIGYENVAGYLHGGLLRWQNSGGPLESAGRATVGQLRQALQGGDGQPLLIDVRQLDEYARGHLPGAVHLNAGDLPDRLADLPRDRPVVAYCASGYRSSVAASLLKQAGFEDVTWLSGGVPAWRAAGFPVEKGEPAAQ